MGLFGEKHSYSELFSEEELREIDNCVLSRMSKGLLYETMGNALHYYLSNSDKKFSKGKFAKFVKIAKEFKKVDPETDAILQKAIDKISKII